MKIRRSDIQGPPGPAGKDGKDGRDGKDGTDASEILEHTKEQTTMMLDLIQKLAELNKEQLNGISKGVKRPKKFVINRDDDGLIESIDII